MKNCNDRKLLRSNRSLQTRHAHRSGRHHMFLSPWKTLPVVKFMLVVRAYSWRLLTRCS